MGRAPCCDKNGLKKGSWTPEEDQKLMDYITKHGYGNWRTLPKNAGLLRCGKSCRLRWTNYLRPDIKRGRFSVEEEETIIQLHSILGNKWSAIAARLPGRTDNEIKNYWNTHIRKRLLRMGIDPVTHCPRLDLLDLSTILSYYPYNSLLSQDVQFQSDAGVFQTQIPGMHFPSNEAQLMNASVADFAEWQSSGTNNNMAEDYVPLPSSYDCYGSEPSNNFSFNNVSVLSTASSSPAPLYFGSTNVNSSAEDERETYCNVMLKFQLPDVCDVSELK